SWVRSPPALPTDSRHAVTKGATTDQPSPLLSPCAGRSTAMRVTESSSPSMTGRHVRRSKANPWRKTTGVPLPRRRRRGRWSHRSRLPSRDVCLWTRSSEGDVDVEQAGAGRAPGEDPAELDGVQSDLLCFGGPLSVESA